MSPVAKSRNGPKDKASDKGKEWKASTRHSPGSGVATNAYNPGSGTFLRLESSSIPETMVVNQTGRFRSIDCADDVGNILVDSDEFGSIIGSYSDSVSNNGSCSGESEDQTHHLHGKAKKPGQSHPPGLVGSGGSDKRDKIRYKNEKKHQRQKERRDQELRDRCTNYLMSRKLEALVQQLVAMGFPSERATMALILNEGHVERSVAWLLEGGEGEVKENWNDNLKIDISEEQARIAELEFRFKYQRVEIERGVVACEGDLEKAAEWLRERHPQLPAPAPRHPQSPTPVPPAVASSATTSASNNSNNINNKERSKDQNFPTPAEAAPYLVNVQGRRSSGLYQVLNNQRREENELQSNPNRSQGQQSSLRPTGTVERSFPLGRTVPQNGSEWQRLSSNISGQYLNSSSVRTSLHAPQSSPHSFPVPGRHVPGTRVSVADNGLPFRNEQTSHLTRDPVVISHLSQSPITPPNIRSSPASPTLSPSSWNGNGLSSSSPSSILYFNVPPGETLGKGGMNRAPGELFTRPVEDTVHVEPVQSNVYSVWGHTGSFGSRDIDAKSSGLRATASHSRSQSIPGFSSGWGSGLTGASSDWSMWLSGACDYKTIDWSMGPSTSTSDTNVWDVTSNLASLLKLSDSGKPRLGIVVGEGTSRGLTASKEDVTSGVNYNLWSTSNRANPVIKGLQEKSLSETGSSATMGVPEWTSPFTGKDLFSLPHEAASPTL